MPSALETLVKILKLERDQGCKNNAVIGGMSAYAANWKNQARSQARNPEQHVLIDELSDLLLKYEAFETKGERLNSLGYMLDRITGRVPIPAAYQARLGNYEVKTTVSQTPAVPPQSAENPSISRPAETQQSEDENQSSDRRQDRRQKQKGRRDRDHEPQGQSTQPPVTPQIPKPASAPPAENRTPQQQPPRREKPRPQQQSGGQRSNPSFSNTPRNFSQRENAESGEVGEMVFE
ncbi:MAG TPA: hypothetical protein VHL11_09075, partial [Phototrophicaceae bacterium]|nr:hypothetical protein [Phototrophicaceae bacterium]